MSVRTIVTALLAAPAITDIVGNRIALVQRPQPASKEPSLVYMIVSDIEEPSVSYEEAPGVLARARVQMNPWAQGVAQVEALHAALYDTMGFLHQQTLGGKLLVSARVDLLGPADKDNDAGLWTQPLDFVLRYYR